MFSSMAKLFTVHGSRCFMLLEVQYRQEDREGIGEDCNYGETVDSPGEGAERVELAQDLLGQRPKADGCEAVSGLADEVIAIVVVPGETVTVGRKAGIAQDGNLSQVDAHDGQVSGHRHDGKDAPCSKTESLEDMDTAQDNCRVGERHETQDLDPSHAVIGAEPVFLYVVIKQTEGGIDEEGRGPLPYPDGSQAEPHGIEPPRRRHRLLVHGELCAVSTTQLRRPLGDSS